MKRKNEVKNKFLKELIKTKWLPTSTGNSITHTYTLCITHTEYIRSILYSMSIHTQKCILMLFAIKFLLFKFLFWTGNKCTSDSDVHSPDFESRTQRRMEKSIKWIHTDEWNHNRPLLYNHYIMIIREALIIFKAQVTYALRPTVDEHN